MFAPFEQYVLPNEKALKTIKTYLKDDETIDELILSSAVEPVLEITDDDRRFIKEIISYWKRGYAIPLGILEEVKRISTGDVSLKNLEGDFILRLYGEEIMVEPDVNLEFAEEFLQYVSGAEILDIASGFGWIPPLLSKRSKVFALDNSYTNKIVYRENGTAMIEGTSIQLFPDSSFKAFMPKKEEFQTYRDFAMLFWKSQNAELGRIVLLEGDAANMRRCRDLTNNKEFEIKDNSFATITCFFGLNHIGDSWKDVLKEIYRVLKPGGKGLVAIYKEYLEKFPIRFAYDWVDQFGMNIIKHDEFLASAKNIGFKTRLIKTHKGERFFYISSLEK